MDKRAAGAPRAQSRSSLTASSPQRLPANSSRVKVKRQSSSDNPTSVYGATVGMALKEAIAIHIRDLTREELVQMLSTVPVLGKRGPYSSARVPTSSAREPCPRG